MGRTYDPVALEILKMARELVINEYTDKRAQDHNKWLANSELLWKTNKVRLPYPDIPPYPTEIEIVKRAQVLMDFLNYNYIDETASQEETVDQPEPKTVTVDEAAPVEMVINDEEITVAEPITESLPANIITEEPVTKSIFPSFFGKNKR
jgi:hypothetical protein